MVGGGLLQVVVFSVGTHETHLDAKRVGPSWLRFLILLLVPYVAPAAVMVAAIWSYDDAAVLKALGSNEVVVVESLRTGAAKLEAMRATVKSTLPLDEDSNLGELNDALDAQVTAWAALATEAAQLANRDAHRHRILPQTIAASYHLKAAVVLQMLMAAAIIVWAIAYLRPRSLRGWVKVVIGVVVTFSSLVVFLWFSRDFRIIDATFSLLVVPAISETIPHPDSVRLLIHSAVGLLVIATGVAITVAAFITSEFELKTPEASARAIGSHEAGGQYRATNARERLRALKQVLILVAALFLATLLMMEMLSAFVVSSLPAKIGGEANPAASELQSLLNAMTTFWAVGFCAALALIYMPSAAYLLPSVKEPSPAAPAKETAWKGDATFNASGPNGGVATLSIAPVPEPAPPATKAPPPPDWSDGVLFIADEKVFGRLAQLATMLSPALFKGFLDLVTIAT